jgi:hypothetical protein
MFVLPQNLRILFELKQTFKGMFLTRLFHKLGWDLLQFQSVFAVRFLWHENKVKVYIQITSKAY